MAFNAYIKIDGIAGEATAKGYEKQIEVVSYSHPISQHSGGSMSAAGGLSGGRAEVGTFTFTKPIDSATPLLLQACCTGTHIKSAVLSVLRATGEGAGTLFYQITMGDVIVAADSSEGTNDPTTPLPQETLGLSFGTISWTYTQVGQDGKKKGDIKTGWDVSKGSKI
jgi:type VI secretion system secreted protein Hcp